MVDVLRRIAPLLLVFASIRVFADNWTQPTPEELAMTAEPAAPGASAVCLSLIQRDQYDHTQMRSIYVRLKILNEKGRDFADVEIPQDFGGFRIQTIEARTIHSDGTVIPFTGKPYDKVIEKTKYRKDKAKVITLPEVQVGSILEYRIVFVSTYFSFSPDQPEWFVQHRFFVRKAHYEYALDWHYGTGLFRYSAVLPKGAVVQYDAKHRIYSLDVERVEPLQEEDWMPPVHSISYRVLFYLTYFDSGEQFWKAAAPQWSQEVDDFIKAGSLVGIAAQITAPGDTPRQKAQKLYDAVMKLENTSFTRKQSKAENKAHQVKTETAQDIWNAKRGDSAEIAVLFVGLARAAGLKAYAAQVTDRSRAIFIPEFLTTYQLDDFVAIVELDGKEEFLDPGERYCAFGELDWKHAGTRGLRQTEHGAALGSTPSLGYKSTHISRSGDLTIDGTGKVQGSIRISMTGNRALAWRQKALGSDEEEVRKDLEESAKKELPESVEVKINQISGLTDYNSPLTVTLNVSGSMGTSTGKRLFLPSTFFEAGDKAIFVEGKRANPVDLQYPYVEQDDVVVHIPPSVAIDSTPKSAEITLPQNALYRASYKKDGRALQASRLFLLANTLYSVEEYGALKDFFQKVNAADQEQAILQLAPSETSGVSASGVH